MSALRKPLAWLCLVGIPSAAFALAWHFIPASEWNDVRALLLFGGEACLQVMCIVGAFAAVVWAFRELTNS